jgi:glycosyltransferase involved in cell wall biosynthesis/O-antigen/teichoic acid export membrane protein
VESLASPVRAGLTRRKLLTSGAALGVRHGLIAAITAGGVLALSHILAPREFAYFGWTISVATVVFAVGDLGYGAALIRSGRARDLAADAIVRHWRRVVPAAVLAGTVVLILPVSSTVRISALLLVVSAALLAAQMVPTAVFEAEGRFAAIGAIEVIQRAALIGAAITLAEIFHRGWAAPAAGAIAGLVGYALALALAGVRRRRGEAASEPIDVTFSRHWLQGRLANQLTYAVYPIVGTAFLTAHKLGFVFWALSVSSLPALGGQLSARILFPAMIGRGEGRSASAHRQVVAALLAVGGPLVSAMIVFAHPLVALVFGRQWLGATLVLQLECATTLLGLILTPSAPVMYLVAGPRTARLLMAGWAALTLALALALIAALGVIAISVATLAASTATMVAFDVVLRRHGQSGLRFVIPGVLTIGACTALGLVFRPPIATLPELALAAGLWWVALFTAVAISLRPSLPGARADIASLVSRLPRPRELGRFAGALLLAAGVAAILLGSTGELTGGQVSAGGWVASGFAACAAALLVLRAPAEAAIFALVFALYIGLSAAFAAAHPARDQVDALAGFSAAQGLPFVRLHDPGPSIPAHAFTFMLTLAGVAGITCLACMVLAARRASREGAVPVIERRRLAQAATLLTAAGALGAVLAALRFLIGQRHAGLSAATLQSFWHGGAYLIFLAQFAIPGLALHLSLRLEARASRRRLIAPLLGLVALAVISIPTGERSFLIEIGLVLVAVAVTHLRWARLAIVPAVLAGVLVLGVTQAARNALRQGGSITPTTVSRQLRAGNWEPLLENQFASFQWAADVRSYGPAIHATNPLVALLAKPIPRQLYPGKPAGLSQRFTEVVYPSAAATGVHFAVPLYAELDYAAGVLGALAGLALLGTALGTGVGRAGRWPLAVRPVARIAFLWGAFELVRGDLSNSVPQALAWLLPLALVLWWARVSTPTTVVLDVLAVPRRHSGVGETVRRIGATLRLSSPASWKLIVRCPGDIRGMIEESFPAGTAIECPLASSRPGWRRLAYQLVVAPIRDTRSTVVLSASEIAAWWGRARRGVIVHDLRRLAAPETASRAERRLYSALVPRAVKGAEAILTVSATTERTLRVRLDPPAPVIIVAPHSGLEPRPRPAGTPPFVLVVSAIRRYKGADLVLDALEALPPETRPDIRWAGAVELDGDEEAALRRRAETAGLRVLGWVGGPELEAMLDAATALLAPSSYEGYGLSLLEGLRRGKPVLASDIPSHREIAGPAALYFDPEDPADLSAVLARVSSGALDTEGLSRASLERTDVLAGAGPSWAQALDLLVASLASDRGSEASCHPGAPAHQEGHG